MNKSKTNTLIAILTAAIILLIPIVAMAADPPALVPKTGQTVSYAIGDNGDYQTGVASPDPRFIDNYDGTITDNLTGLIWLKNAYCFGFQVGYLTGMNILALNNGECGLSDGSAEGDWRLPTKEELQGIGTDPPTTWDAGYPPVAWTMPGSPFVGVQTIKSYWTSTYISYMSANMYILDMGGGRLSSCGRDCSFFVWPVRTAD